MNITSVLRMTTFRLSITGVIGSICALALTICGYPLMLFGTGTVARVCWFSGLIMAAAFVLLLLGTTAKSTLEVARKKAPRRDALVPAFTLIFLYVAWWRLFVFCSHMP